MSIGSDLKQSRESKKISLETLSQKTKIPVKYLESIEENRFDVFPSHTYAKGFIRAYAKVVGMDQQVLTRQFNLESKPEEIRIQPMNAEAELEKNLGWRPTLDRPPVFRPVEDKDLDLETDGDFPEEPARRDSSVMRQRAWKLKNEKWMKWLGSAALGLTVLLLAGAVLYLGARAFRHLRRISSRSAAQAQEAPGSGPAVADKYQHLILKALDKSWVLVTMDDGQSSSELDMDPGEVKTYKASKDFKVKLGNAGGVDVQFNGKSLGILGTEGQVVEITLPPGSWATPAQNPPQDSDPASGDKN